jgi:hypothetical protein
MKILRTSERPKSIIKMPNTSPNIQPQRGSLNLTKRQ